jgi:hypothetical protein
MADGPSVRQRERVLHAPDHGGLVLGDRLPRRGGRSADARWHGPGDDQLRGVDVDDRAQLVDVACGPEQPMSRMTSAAMMPIIPGPCGAEGATVSAWPPSAISRPSPA